MSSRYDPEMEAEVCSWFTSLLGEEMPNGMYEVREHLKSGVLLLKLAQKVQEMSPNCPEPAKKMILKINESNIPYKQMVNLQTFLMFCRNYGVPRTSLFQPPDLYESRNLPMVLATIMQLGSVAQRNGFTGEAIGPKPSEENVRTIKEEELIKGKTVIGMQAGTNQYASQKGMTAMGGKRFGADIRADQMNKDGKSLLIFQSGAFKGATQSGMTIGGVRHGNDIRTVDMDKEGQTLLTLQQGGFKGASQKGLVMGSVRHGADIRADDVDKEGQTVVGLQVGGYKGASQQGMTSMGAVRHAADIRADDILREGQGMIGCQSGYTEGASQKGMSIGAVRHGSDIKVEESSREGQGLLFLQNGTNVYANQSGMKIGTIRHICDIKSGEVTLGGSSVIGLQMGSNKGASQAGMSFGVRHAGDIMSGELSHEVEEEE